MFNLKNFAKQAMLALALVLGSGAAFAGPNYLVTIHTQAYSGESGLFDFGFLGDAAATSEFVTLSNFMGDFGGQFDRGGAVVGDVPGTVVFGNSGGSNYLTQEVILGGDFSFNLSFSGSYAWPADPADAAGLTFVIALFDALMTEELARIVQFDLLPFNNGEAPSVTVTPNADFPDLVTVSEVAEVPEPSQLLLMLSALALAGVALRRRNGGTRGRHRSLAARGG